MFRSFYQGLMKSLIDSLFPKFLRAIPVLKSSGHLHCIVDILAPKYAQCLLSLILCAKNTSAWTLGRLEGYAVAHAADDSALAASAGVPGLAA